MPFFLRKSIKNVQDRRVPKLPFYLLKLKCNRRKRQKFFLNTSINIFRKNVIILRPFLFYKFLVHVGRMRKNFINNISNLGFKFGEFFMTRRFGSGSIIHARKKKKSKK
jgi:ribosomal protein S19